MVAAASAIFFMVAAVAAAIVVLPLSLLAWLLRLKVNAEISAERQKVLAQVIEFFHDVQHGSNSIPAGVPH